MKFYKIKYNNRIIILGYSQYKSFEWYCTKIKGSTILCINNNSSSQDKRKILHSVIRKIS
ncbi:hypothetical protein [Clostridium sp. CF012]|uniref:hypothetical protein n=1 Tax=Clostridium sp. CF012 TaxID=2843319 RepID=UPI001C0E1306|nr:hypothetical protein [Clostridium sp. CF012]MBU3145529.1 hypothetical protein [Clostridium sp. CF012]